MDQFATELQKELLEVFLSKDYIDFTFDKNMKKKIYDIMVQILKFDLNKLTEINENIK